MVKSYVTLLVFSAALACSLAVDTSKPGQTRHSRQVRGRPYYGRHTTNHYITDIPTTYSPIHRPHHHRVPPTYLPRHTPSYYRRRTKYPRALHHHTTDIPTTYYPTTDRIPTTDIPTTNLYPTYYRSPAVLTPRPTIYRSRYNN